MKQLKLLLYHLSSFGNELGRAGKQQYQYLSQMAQTLTTCVPLIFSFYQ